MSARTGQFINATIGVALRKYHGTQFAEWVINKFPKIDIRDKESETILAEFLYAAYMAGYNNGKSSYQTK